MKARKFTRQSKLRAGRPPAEAQVAFARVATSLAWTALGAMAVGATAAGAVAIGAVAIRKLAIKRGRIQKLSIEELEVGRLYVREWVQEGGDPRPFEPLEGHNYVSLTTFRKSGEAVSTPVWFVLHNGKVYITTDPASGKMKRIRNNSRVLLTPCYPWGKTRGQSVEGVARPLEPGTAPEDATQAFARKYRLGLGVIHLLGWQEVGTLTLEIRPADSAQDESEVQSL